VPTTTEPPWPFDPDREAARQRVSTPAVILGLLGVLGILRACWDAFSAVLGGGQGNEELLRSLVHDEEVVRRALEFSTGPVAVVGALFALAASALVVIGAYKMYRLETWGLAVAAACVAVFPCTSPCCCCLGLPVGVWALIVLMDPKVQDAFR
jgi:hypothetical protein